MDHEPVDVDHIVRHETVDQLAAAVDEDVLPGLLLQLPNLFGDVALEQRPVPSSGSLRLCETTNFGRLFILTANSPSVSSAPGQAAAKPVNVFRPSNSASLPNS